MPASSQHLAARSLLQDLTTLSTTALPKPRRIRPRLSTRRPRRFPPKSAKPALNSLPSPLLPRRDSSTASTFFAGTKTTSSAGPHQLHVLSDVLVCDRSQQLARFPLLISALPLRRNKRVATRLPRYISTCGDTPHHDSKLFLRALHRSYFTPRQTGRPSQPATRPTLRAALGARPTKLAA
jgi:hypothetical protein